MIVVVRPDRTTHEAADAVAGPGPFTLSAPFCYPPTRGCPARGRAPRV